MTAPTPTTPATTHLLSGVVHDDLATLHALHALLALAHDTLVVAKAGSALTTANANLRPFYDALAHAHPDALFLDLDTDRLPALTAAYHLNGDPTVLFFRRGHEVTEARVVGAHKAQISSAISTLLTPQ
jgi:hypothetical protein